MISKKDETIPLWIRDVYGRMLHANPTWRNDDIYVSSLGPSYNMFYAHWDRYSHDITLQQFLNNGAKK